MDRKGRRTKRKTGGKRNRAAGSSAPDSGPVRSAPAGGAEELDDGVVYALTEDTMVPAQRMAAILGITDKSLQRLATDHKMPKVGYGQYPVGACILWYIKFWQDKALGRESNNAKRSKEESEALIARAKYEELTGHLVSRVEVVQAFSAAFIRLGKTLDGLPRLVANRLNLSSEAQRLMRAEIDEARRKFVKDTQEYIDVVDDGSGSATG